MTKDEFVQWLEEQHEKSCSDESPYDDYETATCTIGQLLERFRKDFG